MKHSTFHGVVAWSGGSMVLKQDQRFEDSHPLVKERPDLFADGDTDAGVMRTPEPGKPAGVVESTMQPPGSTRAARVPKGGSAQ